MQRKIVIVLTIFFVGLPVLANSALPDNNSPRTAADDAHQIKYMALARDESPGFIELPPVVPNRPNGSIKLLPAGAGAGVSKPSGTPNDAIGVIAGPRGGTTSSPQERIDRGVKTLIKKLG
jgi:hypothetical protein